MTDRPSNGKIRQFGLPRTPTPVAGTLGLRQVDDEMSSSKSPRVALIHATPVSVDPIHAAFASGWPNARTVNILDDSLADDRALTPGLPDRMFERFATLSRYAFDAGADA